MSQTFNPIWQQTLVFSHCFQVLQAFRPFPAFLPRGWIRSSLFSKGREPKHWGWGSRLMSPGTQFSRGPAVKGSAMSPLSASGRGAVREESLRPSTENPRSYQECPHTWTRGFGSKQLDLQAGQVFGALLPTGRVWGRRGCLWNMPSFFCGPLPAS